MFLKKLYEHSKFLFVVFISFILSFIFLNYKWGVVATPIYQYGMFSGTAHLKDTLTMMEININGVSPDMSQYSFISKDKMLVMPEKYLLSLYQNAAVQATMQSIFSKIGIGNWMHGSKFISDVNSKTFMLWYQHQLQYFVKANIDSIQINQRKLLWNGSKIVPLGLPQKISTLAYP
ncbi:MAG: hypothetical protein WEA59_08570 [Ferruginibacter sp.]